MERKKLYQSLIIILSWRRLSQIISEGLFTGLARIHDIGSSVYGINHDVGLFIKHASNDDSPWQFTFSAEHKSIIRKLFDRKREKTYIALVCGHIGICLLEYR